MRVVHITTVPKSLRFIRGQSEFMRERGLELVVLSSPEPFLAEFGHNENVAVHYVEMSRRVTPFHDVRAVRRMASELAIINPLIVHAHTPKGGLLGMIGATLARVPVRIYHIRGFPYMAATGKRRFILKSTERVSCRLAHRVFCVSHSIRQVAIADRICPEEKIVVFAGGSGNGVDAARHFDPSRFSTQERLLLRTNMGIGPSDIVVGFVGRIVRDKGIEDLSIAWDMLREEFPSLRLALIGPVESKDPVSPQTLKKLEQDPRVVMTGEIDDISPYYAIFDLFVLPSYREGLPNVLLEASAMEVAVIATTIPGCVDVVQDGVTGTLVPPRRPLLLAGAIRRYLNDAELRRMHGEAGRELVQGQFRQEVIWQEYYEEYCRLLKEKDQWNQ